MVLYYAVQYVMLRFNLQSSRVTKICIEYVQKRNICKKKKWNNNTFIAENLFFFSYFFLEGNHSLLAFILLSAGHKCEDAQCAILSNRELLLSFTEL